MTSGPPASGDGRANGGGVGSVYDFWLGLLPKFFAQFGVPPATAGSGASATAAALPFPADQIARAATMTQSALQALAQAYAPLLQAAGTQGLLGQWTSGSASLAPIQQALGVPAPSAAAVNAMLSADTASTAFERTFGAVSDALGFGPLRKLQSAAQDVVSAGIEQNDARARYAMLVQRAFSAGFDVLLERLAAMARSGERVDSVLALLRLWAVATEQAVHDVLQSDEGLEATAAIARASLAYRRRLQHVASLVADALDMATRRDLDEAFREIQGLKRELRAMRAALPAPAAAERPATPRNRARKGKSTR